MRVAGDGSPDSFYRLGRRLAASRPATVAHLLGCEPLTLIIFDVLWLDDRPLIDSPYGERRRCLGMRSQLNSDPSHLGIRSRLG